MVLMVCVGCVAVWVWSELRCERCVSGLMKGGGRVISKEGKGGGKQDHNKKDDLLMVVSIAAA